MVKTLDDIMNLITEVKYGYEIEIPDNAGIYIELNNTDYKNFIDNFETLISPLSSKQSISEVVPGIIKLKFNDINIIIGKS